MEPIPSPPVARLADLLAATPSRAPDDGTPLARRLATSIAEAILSGRLRPGTRLPATRRLATDMGIARNTVTAAYDRLLAEGYVTARVGAGTFVSADLPESRLETGQAVAAPGPAPQISALASRLQSSAARHVPRPSDPLPFRAGVPALDAFPWSLWSRLLGRRWRRPGAALTMGDHPGGLRRLREAVAEVLRATRGLVCTAEQVLILGGAQQALDLTARLLLNPGDRVLIEDPGFSGADAALLAVGAHLRRQPVDDDGLIIPDALDGIKAIMVTPSRNYPLGVTLSLPRRLALLETAARAGTWVIEDDYDSDFRFDGRPVAALQGLDRSERVLYAGTFSRALFPALRLGYLVVPPGLVDAAHAVRRAMDGHESSVAQAALADFITEGHYAAHMRLLRRLYTERAAALTDALDTRLAGLLTLGPSDGGMHLTALLPAAIDDRAVASLLARKGLVAAPLSPFHHTEPGRSGLVLGFSGWPPPALRAAANQLSDALDPLPDGLRRA